LSKNGWAIAAPIVLINTGWITHQACSLVTCQLAIYSL
jgi:hypothetical protein